MSSFARPKTALAAVLCAALPAAIACGGTATTSAPPPPPVARVAPSASAAASSLPPELKGPEYTENDFVESDRNRDPFRSFIIQNQQVSKQALNQRKVELAQYSIDELKLVAIVQGADYPRAMVVDPRGRGQVLKRGDFVGRAETVHTGGTNGTDYQVNWRVDRVRDGDVVFIRLDPAQPNIAPATRVVPLHPATNDQQQGEGDSTEGM